MDAQEMETQKIKIAVVVLNWDGKVWLDKFLPFLTKYSQEATIFMADNASDDNSVEFIKSNFPEVKIIRNDINGGYAKGYNDAFKKLMQSILCLLTLILR
jgi:hypothetical protein